MGDFKMMESIYVGWLRDVAISVHSTLDASSEERWGARAALIHSIKVFSF
jgi:hypothetical protein